MEYITSRSFKLPTDSKEFEEHDWFNMWQNQLFPYKELLEGDTLYWYDSVQKRIVWKTKISKIVKFPYDSKSEIIKNFKDVSNQAYFEQAKDKGYFISYKVKVEAKVAYEKPKDFRFPMTGWVKLDEEKHEKWGIIKGYINEKRISRIAYNSNGWIMPSGPYGKSNHKDSHEANYGYGHEEWLFDTSKLIDGYHYGFLEPIRKQQFTYLGQNFNVWLYTIDGVSKSRYWVGEINNLEVINQKKANSIKSIYKENGWLQEMEEQIVESGANNRGFSDWEGVDLFNVRFKPKDLTVNDPYYELASNHPINSLSRYNFSHFKDEFEINLKNESLESFSFNPDEENENSDETEGVEKTQHKREPKTIEITYLHKAISRQLTKVLKGIYGHLNVKAEHPSGIGANKVDVVVNSENEGLIFYEIKTYNSVKSSIREAIGQLFEYSFWPYVDNAKQLVIITQKHNDLKEVKSYFKHLRDKLGIQIYYQWFDIENNELSEKY